MIKQVTERPRGYRRTITHNIMVCDCCGKRIEWVAYSRKGQFCEKCLKAMRQEEKTIQSANAGC